jgi:DNA-binding NarL/FixJ family response regulator
VLDAELGVDTSTRTDEVPPEPATLVRAVRRAAPRCRIVLRADHTDARLRRAGACAVIDAREPLAALCHAVLPVRRASPARQSCPARHAEAGPLGRLSPRERVILARLATGASTACVARSLRITQQTVRAHVRSILRKLDAHSRLAALAMVEAGGELDALLAHERARQT